MDDAALVLVARAAEGSMRDAQSAFDQVIAFAGQRSRRRGGEVLGLVGRDLLLDIVDGRRRRNARRSVRAGRTRGRDRVGSAARAVASCRAWCATDGAAGGSGAHRRSGIAVEGDRERLDALARRFSREDLLRAFDLIAKLETDMRTRRSRAITSRWRCCAGFICGSWCRSTELLRGMSRQGASARAAEGRADAFRPVERRQPPSAAGSRRRIGQSRRTAPVAKVAAPARRRRAPSTVGTGEAGTSDAFLVRDPHVEGGLLQHGRRAGAEDRVRADRVTFVFLPAHRTSARAARAERAWLEELASRHRRASR